MLCFQGSQNAVVTIESKPCVIPENYSPQSPSGRTHSISKGRSDANRESVGMPVVLDLEGEKRKVGFSKNSAAASTSVEILRESTFTVPRTNRPARRRSPIRNACQPCSSVQFRVRCECIPITALAARGAVRFHGVFHSLRTRYTHQRGAICAHIMDS